MDRKCSSSQVLVPLGGGGGDSDRKGTASWGSGLLKVFIYPDLVVLVPCLLCGNSLNYVFYTSAK